MTVILASAFGLALNLNAVSNDEELEAFRNSAGGNHRVSYDTAEAVAAYEYALANLPQDTLPGYYRDVILRGALHAPVTFEDAQAGFESLIDHPTAGAPTVSLAAAYFISRGHGDREYADAAVQAGTLLPVHQAFVGRARDWADFEENGHIAQMGTGALGRRYQAWLRQHVSGLSDAAAIEVLSAEIRVLLGVPESEARNAWLKELRAQLAVRRELAAD